MLLRRPLSLGLKNVVKKALSNGVGITRITQELVLQTPLWHLSNTFPSVFLSFLLRPRRRSEVSGFGGIDCSVVRGS